MHSKRRLLTGLLAGALTAALLPSAASAEIIDGLPGQLEMTSMTIDATNGDCRATYKDRLDNIYVRGESATVHVVVNRNGAHASCHFTDISVVNEDNAEVGYTSACELITEDGTWSDGVGRVTSAANISDRADGGNSVMTCHFRTVRAPGEPVPGAARRPALQGRSTEGAGEREPGKPTWAAGPKTPAAAAHPRDEHGSKRQALRTEKAPKGPPVSQDVAVAKGRSKAKGR